MEQSIFENVYFILVEPHTPGNIGSVCRAIKTMGFRHLRLVNPSADLDHPELRWLAHGAEDIVESITVFPTIREAIADLHWTIGTTNRERGLRLPYYTSYELPERLIPVAVENKVGLLFGRERTGLTNEELYFCNAVSYIPAHTRKPSLNLSHAVQVFAYELYRQIRGKDKFYRLRHASQEEIQHLYQHLRELLTLVEFVPKDSMDTFIMRFQRWFGRSQPESRDVRVLHTIFKSVEFYIHQLKNHMQGKNDSP